VNGCEWCHPYQTWGTTRRQCQLRGDLESLFVSLLHVTYATRVGQPLRARVLLVALECKRS
jgi:hypothetical protein